MQQYRYVLSTGSTLLLYAILIITVLFQTACGGEVQRAAAEMTGGDPARGRQLIRTYGCHTCHAIPGVQGADGLVGPPLVGMAKRVYIAGRLHNTPENMIRWLQDPQAFDSPSGMPNMGVTEPDARDIAGYLYTLTTPPSNFPAFQLRNWAEPLIVLGRQLSRER